jgi:glycosyltransferase involved in cell wall biosynthesis
MNSSSTVSVIVPSLNAAPYIRQTIDSALSQTHAVREIIVVDGGSRDGTGEIVLSYGAPVRLIDQRGSGRKGIAGARNLGLEASSGDWVAFLDADDWWDPQMVEKQLAGLRENPAAAVSYTASYWVDQLTGTRLFHRVNDASRLWPTLRWNNLICNSSVLARREAVLSVGTFREDLVCFEDWEMWVRLRQRYTFISRPEPLLYYRVLSQGISHNVKLHVAGIPGAVGPMLIGVSGWRRKLFRQYIWAAQLRAAAIEARQAGSREYRALAWRSVAMWPLPTFYPDRFVIALRALAGA